MPTSTTALTGEDEDASPSFIEAVSLLAALEGAVEHPGHAEVLPFLGMARAELTHFGQRRPSHYAMVEVDDVEAGLLDLERRLTALLTSSRLLQEILRVSSARQLLRRGIAAVA